MKDGKFRCYPDDLTLMTTLGKVGITSEVHKKYTFIKLSFVPRFGTHVRMTQGLFHFQNGHKTFIKCNTFRVVVNEVVTKMYYVLST